MPLHKEVFDLHWQLADLLRSHEGERTVGIEILHKMPAPFSFPSDRNPIARHFTDMKNSVNAMSLTTVMRTEKAFFSWSKGAGKVLDSPSDTKQDVRLL